MEGWSCIEITVLLGWASASLRLINSPIASLLVAHICLNCVADLQFINVHAAARSIWPKARDYVMFNTYIVLLWNELEMLARHSIHRQIAVFLAFLQRWAGLIPRLLILGHFLHERSFVLHVRLPGSAFNSAHSVTFRELRGAIVLHVTLLIGHETLS